jgi:hypothetical protein
MNSKNEPKPLDMGICIPGNFIDCFIEVGQQQLVPIHYYYKDWELAFTLN